MNQLQLLISYACVLVASIMLGNWFMQELRKAKAQNRPWYRVYFFTPPGILILIAIIILPILHFFL